MAAFRPFRTWPNIAALLGVLVLAASTHPAADPIFRDSRRSLPAADIKTFDDKFSRWRLVETDSANMVRLLQLRSADPSAIMAFDLLDRVRIRAIGFDVMRFTTPQPTSGSYTARLTKGGNLYISADGHGGISAQFATPFESFVIRRIDGDLHVIGEERRLVWQGGDEGPLPLQLAPHPEDIRRRSILSQRE